MDSFRKENTELPKILQQYIQKRMILADLAKEIRVSVPTLRKNFDKLSSIKTLQEPTKKEVNLVFDAVYFGRNYGFFVFSNSKKIIHFCEIKTETQENLQKALKTIENKGFSFKSFTCDGRRNLIWFLKKTYLGILIQLCIFHQKAIISRYITQNPRTGIGLEIKKLTASLQTLNEATLLEKTVFLQDKHKVFLAEKNLEGKFKHKRYRAALKSFKNNAKLLFKYQENLQIPGTTNCLEGIFLT